MKNSVSLILIMWLSLGTNLNAQTFTVSPSLGIPDNNTTGICSTITTSGLGVIDGAALSLLSVCINITHTFVGDLTITIEAPDGTLVSLTAANGAGGDNYQTTCFKMLAGTNITAGSPPYNGDYVPQGNLGNVNNGQAGNGDWKLCMVDGSAGDAGTLNNWSLTFGVPPVTTPGGTNCASSAQFCTDSAINYTIQTNNSTAESGPDYGCLCNQPNPTWFHMQVETAGDFTINIASSCGDVDFAAWGPFPSFTCVPSDLNATGAPKGHCIGAGDGTNPNYSAVYGSLIDCSYAIDATEDLQIASSNIGDFFILMITNFDNCNGNINFSQTGGAGSASCTPLSIELHSFTGISINARNKLEWQTSSELNNDYFIIESGDDGENFSELARVDGAGNSSTLINYKFEDVYLKSDLTYYRLKQIDFDGNYTYSSIIAVNSNVSIHFFPNPTSGVLNMKVNSIYDDLHEVIISDVIGNVSHRQIEIFEGNNTITLKEFENFEKGIYFIQVVNQRSVLVHSYKIVVN